MTHPDPRLLDRATLDGIRARASRTYSVGLDEPSAEVDRRALLAHLDAITEAVEAALTSEDEIAHGEAYEPSRGGLGVCAYCDDPWPCRTQQAIDRLRDALLQAKEPHP